MTTVDRPTSQGWVADDSTFGARLALVRQHMRWGNVKEAAVACGLPTESWRSWERDGRAPQRLAEIAGIIADRTGCDFGWLVAGPRASGGGAAKRLTVPYPQVTVRSPVSSRPRDNRPNGRAMAETASAAGRTTYIDRSRPPRRDR